MSSGHMEQAQAVLVTASEQVPVEHVVAALEAMGTVAQHVEQVGGGDGQEAVRRVEQARANLENQVAELAQLRAELAAIAETIVKTGNYHW